MPGRVPVDKQLLYLYACTPSQDHALITRLPLEILRQILSNLPISSLAAVARTCKVLFALVAICSVAHLHNQTPRLSSKHAGCFMVVASLGRLRTGLDGVKTL